MASTADSVVYCPVRRTISAPGSNSRTCSSSSIPLIPGIIKSLRTRWGCSFRISSSPSRGFTEVETATFSRERAVAMNLRCCSSSSIATTRSGELAVADIWIPTRRKDEVPDVDPSQHCNSASDVLAVPCRHNVPERYDNSQRRLRSTEACECKSQSRGKTEFILRYYTKYIL